jgi:hypothetical protein
MATVKDGKSRCPIHGTPVELNNVCPACLASNPGEPASSGLAAVPSTISISGDPAGGGTPSASDETEPEQKS